MQLQMQTIELKPTDLWDFLALPFGFLDGWNIVSGAIADYKESLRDNDG